MKTQEVVFKYDDHTEGVAINNGCICPFLKKKCIEDKCQLWISNFDSEGNLFSECAICMNVYKGYKHMV